MPLAGVGSGISRLLTDNRMTRPALPQRADTSLCEQGVMRHLAFCVSQHGVTQIRADPSAARSMVWE